MKTGCTRLVHVVFVMIEIITTTTDKSLRGKRKLSENVHDEDDGKG